MNRTCFKKLPVLLCPIENKSTPIAEVKKSNGAPVAVVGPNRQLTLPVTSVTLDGSSSTDDHAVTSYHWDTIRYQRCSYMSKVVSRRVYKDMKNKLKSFLMMFFCVVL